MSENRAQELDRGEYYASREWGLKKREVRQRSGGYCERHRKANPRGPWPAAENVNHRTYERFGAELPEDLEHLCRDCHLWVNGNSDIDPIIVRPALVPTPLDRQARAMAMAKTRVAKALDKIDLIGQLGRTNGTEFSSAHVTTMKGRILAAVEQAFDKFGPQDVL